MAGARLAAAAMSVVTRIPAVSRAGAGMQRVPALHSRHFLLSAPAGLPWRSGSASLNQGVNVQTSTVIARSYAFDAAAAPPAAAAEIGEVDFDPAFANTVRLIGTVGLKQDMKVFERSKLLPFSLGVKTDRRRPDEIEWLSVEVWGPLAERVEAEVQKGDRLAVQGRLRVNSWQDRETGAKRKAYSIVANSISRVRRTGSIAAPGTYDDAGAGMHGGASAAPAASEPAPWDVAPQQQQQSPAWDPQPAAAAYQQAAAPAQGRAQGLLTEEELWMEFFTDPSQWYDNRENKTNPKAPDFKKKAGGRDAPALWLSSRGRPAWVLAELKQMDDQRSMA